MNQKDYKNIARIMKSYKLDNKDYIEPEEDEVLQENKGTIEGISNELSSYFEREDEYKITNCGGGRFNKQQFLKMCGVEK